MAKDKEKPPAEAPKRRISYTVQREGARFWLERVITQGERVIAVETLSAPDVKGVTVGKALRNIEADVVRV